MFQEEPIRPREPRPAERVPSLIRAARSLETGLNHNWQSREAIFMKQAKLLAAYEDDYVYSGSVVRYYPTYQSLTDSELRGYFSWRTKLRRGDVRKTSLSFAFLYIYELINQIGVAGPMEGFLRLRNFRDTYGEIDGSILPYLSKWLADYVIYYELDANLLADTPQVLFDRSVTVLEYIREQEEAKVICAVKQLSPKWLSRSKFYGEYRADCDTVIVRVLRRISDHCAARCKRSFTEQYFGSCREYQVRLFDSAVFCDPLKKRSCEYAVDERCVYRCKNGLWTVTKLAFPPGPNGKLEDLLKTIDAVMREEYGYGHPIQYKTDTKWLLKIIREEAQTLLAEKKAAEAKESLNKSSAAERRIFCPSRAVPKTENTYSIPPFPELSPEPKSSAAGACRFNQSFPKKITIDYSRLAKIRQDAAVTREKLIVDEEEDLPEAPETPGEAPPVSTDATPLDPAEYRLLQCLLYGRDCGWVQSEGYLLSVLVDSINEKLYDEFMDSVLDDSPAPVEDYIDDLKEMIHP